MTQKQSPDPARKNHPLEATGRTFAQAPPAQAVPASNRVLFDTLPLGVIYRDADCHLLDANPTARQMLGIGQASLLGTLLPDLRWRIVLPDGTDLAPDDYPSRVALRTGQPVRNQILGIQPPDAPLRWLNVTAIPEFAPDQDHPHQVYSLLEDITDRYNAEAALEKSNRQMRIAQRIAHIGSWEWNLTQNKIVCSDEMYRLMGRTADQLLTLENFLDTFHPEDRERMAQALSGNAQDGAPLSLYYRVLWPDGTQRWLHAQGETARRDQTGRPVLIVGIVRDITDERNLLTAKQELSSLLEHSREGIFRSTPQGRYEMVNPALARMFGYDTPQEMIEAVTSTRDQIFVDPARRDQFQALIRETGFVNDFEAKVRRKDGTTFWVKCHTRAVRDPHGNVIAYEGFTEDITARIDHRPQKDHVRENRHRTDHDPLTGLLQHRTFQRCLAETLGHARRRAAPLALVLLDIDNFTFFNDTFGYQVGDDVLRQVARRLQEICRPIDTIARYGGDEFALLLPDPPSSLSALEAQLCSDLSGLTFHVAAQEQYIPITLSFGTAALEPSDRGAGDLLARARERLQVLKSGGRQESDATLLRNVLHNQVDGFSMLDALVTAIDNKDRYTRRHSEEVMTYSLHLAQALGLPPDFQHTLAVAALIHDVGKIGTPDAVLRKPSHLTEAEFATIRQHPEMGAAIVAAIPGLEATLPAVRHHHEQWDGRGYPDSLTGESIPLIARIMAIADAYSAMTSDRPYRAGLAPAVAQARLRAGAGIQWDPTLITTFLTHPPP